MNRNLQAGGTAVDSFGGVDILVNNAFGRFSFDPRRRSTLLEAIGMSLAHRSRMPAWCISMCSICGAADASPDLRAYHQHLQQSGQFAHRALPFVCIAAKAAGQHDPLSGPGAGRFGIQINAIAAGLTVGTASSAAATEDVRERIIAARRLLAALPVPMTSPEGSRCWRPTWPASLPGNVCTSMVV